MKADADRLDRCRAQQLLSELARLAGREREIRSELLELLGIRDPLPLRTLPPHGGRVGEPITPSVRLEDQP
jgi:hypothetical protein